MPIFRTVVLAGLLLALLCIAAAPCMAAQEPVTPWERLTQQKQQQQADSQEQQGGGLIQSLFSDRHFTGLTVGDIAFLGLLAAIVGYLYVSSRSSRENANKDYHAQSNGNSGQPPVDDVPGPGRNSRAYQRGEQMWDHLSSKPPRRPSRPAPPTPPPDVPEQDIQNLAKDLPQTPSSKEAGFDTDDLLQGAKVVYARMHESMAQADWDDIRYFTTPEFMEHLRQQISGPMPEPQVMFVEAGIQDARILNGRAVASVVFSSLIQFPGESGPPQEVREIWRFEKEIAVQDATWRISFMQRQK